MAEPTANEIQIEQIKAGHAHRLEGANGTLQFAVIPIRSLILVNGAAVAGILTFLGNLWTKDGPMARATAQGIGPAMKYFVIGVGLGVSTAMLAYLSQAAIFELKQPKPGTDPYVGTCFRAAAILCALASFGVFAWGAALAVKALQASPLVG